MNDATWIPEALLAARAICHFLIGVQVLVFTAHEGSHHRKVVGLVASVCIGTNFAESVRILSNFTDYAQSTEPYLPIIMATFLVFITWSHGNVAAFFPRKVLDRLP